MKLIRLIFAVNLHVFLFISDFCYATDLSDLQGELGIQRASISTLYSSSQASSLQNILPIDQVVQWQVYVPNSAEFSSIKNKNVLVYISPSGSGAPPKSWLPVLDKHNVIFIGADGFGNKIPVKQRIFVAAMATKMLQTKLDPDVNLKTYLAGFSGGGRAASIMIELFPGSIEGAAYFSGVNFWDTRDKKLIGEIIEKPFIFMTGHKDFNRRDTLNVHKKYKGAGAKNILLMDIPRYGHQLPNQRQFEAAIAFLIIRD